MKKKVLLLIIAATIAMASAALATEEVLSLDKFVKLAVKTNPRYQISAKDYLIALKTDESADSIGDWNLIASAIYIDSNPSPISYFTSYQNTLGYTLGVEKYFSETGTTVNLEHGNTKVRTKYQPLGGFPLPPSPSYTANLSLSITQPLLKDAFGFVTKKSLEMSDQSLALAEIKLSEDWEDFIAYLVDEYRSWQRSKTNLEVYKNKLQRVESQLYLVERQREVGLSEELDLIQVRQKFQGYKLLLAQAKLEFDAQSKRVMRIIGKKDKALTSIPEAYEKNSSVLPEEEAMSYLTSKSKIKNTADLLVSLQLTNLEMKENETLPEAVLYMEANPNSYSEGLEDSVAEIGEYRDYTVSLSVSRPLFNDLSDSERDRAKEEYEKALEERDEIMLESETGLENLYINLKYLDAMIELNKHNRELAEQRLSLEKEKYNQGRNTVFFVLQAEDDLLEAENRLNETLFAREVVINQIKSFTDKYAVEYADVLKIEN
jgi:outer membrane protein TolC